MPRTGPPISGYQALSQDADLTDSDDEHDALISHPTRYTSIQPQPTSRPTRTRPRRSRSTSTVDIKVINARLERWADQIANKFKFKKGKGQNDEPPLEILYSVFVPPEGGVSANAALQTRNEEQFTREMFEEIVSGVEEAIRKGVHPKLIKQGSSGSYFARNKDGKVVGVFKPKDEEPYGDLNPKMMKWLHRTLFPCFFGRACLIPNLSYISEAAACLLDRQLKTYMVPFTDVVRLSSKAFHYGYWDRRAFYRRRKPLPPKIGSFQVFLQGYQDANIFLRNNPWPDSTYNGEPERQKKRRRGWGYACGPGEAHDSDSESELDGVPSPDRGRPRRFVWTEELKQNFREELEKLVILDYIMRNTDRGLDNWMVKVDYETGDVAIHSKPVSMSMDTPGAEGSTSRPPSTGPPSKHDPIYRVQEQMSTTSSRASTPLNQSATIKIGAIDNSLAFPWKHPDQWRSFPFGWLFLPVSLIGQPFSQKTRDHFLPLLTSTKWWSETQMLLRKLFEQDADFKERMFQRQLAVLKGQAWNVVETLKMPDQGPLELTRRARIHVWDDEMEVPIAVPLQVPPHNNPLTPSAASSPTHNHPEELDISTFASAPVPNLLDDFTPAPRSTLPSSVRLSKPLPPSPPRKSAESEDLGGLEAGLGRNGSGGGSRPMNGRGAMSFDAGMSGRRRRESNAYWEEDGDLGYSVIDGSERATKKVIAERLETVKARNPVFTWC